MGSADDDDEHYTCIEHVHNLYIFQQQKNSFERVAAEREWEKKEERGVEVVVSNDIMCTHKKKKTHTHRFIWNKSIQLCGIAGYQHLILRLHSISYYPHSQIHMHKANTIWNFISF